MHPNKGKHFTLKYSSISSLSGTSSKSRRLDSGSSGESPPGDLRGLLVTPAYRVASGPSAEYGPKSVRLGCFQREERSRSSAALPPTNAPLPVKQRLPPKRCFDCLNVIQQMRAGVENRPVVHGLRSVASRALNGHPVYRIPRCRCFRYLGLPRNRRIRHEPPSIWSLRNASSPSVRVCRTMPAAWNVELARVDKLNFALAAVSPCGW